MSLSDKVPFFLPFSASLRMAFMISSAFFPSYFEASAENCSAMSAVFGLFACPFAFPFACPGCFHQGELQIGSIRVAAKYHFHKKSSVKIIL